MPWTIVPRFIKHSLHYFSWDPPNEEGSQRTLSIRAWVPTSVVCVSVNSRVYTACKSSVSVNHLQLHVKKIYAYTYPVAVYIFTLTWGQCQYLSNTLARAHVNVLGRVSVNTKIICKVTLSLGLLSPKPFFNGYP
jgi:hypothetical protein